MFRLLSKEVKMFSIPIYIGLVIFVILTTNNFSFSFINIISNLFAFAGISLGYILFNKLALNRHSHLPLFLYSIFILSFYPENLDIGISMAIFINSILLFFLTDDSLKLRENSYFLIGNLLALSFIFLPNTWALSLFVLIHIIATSDKILSNIAKMLWGIIIIFLGYFCFMYSIGFKYFNPNYFPLISSEIQTNFSKLYFLVPIITFCILGIMDHFINFNKKSPQNKFKYSFILAFLLTQCLILTFYMGENYEYLLLVTFPVCVIVSRFLRFLNKYWLQEIGLWLIIISCLFSFKLNTFFLFN